MPAHPRLTAVEKEDIRSLLAEGFTVAQIRKKTGRSKDAIGRLRTGDVALKEKYLNLRLTQDEFDAVHAAAQAQGLTASDYARRVLRGGVGQLAVSEEVTLAFEEARKQLSALGTNLNQLVTLGHQGKVKWNPGDSRMIESLQGSVRSLTGQVIKVVLAARRNVALDLQKVTARLAG